MMSQRTIHSCVTNMNMETIQCDAYTGKLGPKVDKSKGAPVHKAPPNRIIRECSLPSTYKTTSMASGRMKQVKVETSKPEKPKTAPRMRSNSVVSQGNTWSKILKPQASKENIYTFKNFNPLRTIHFLTNELGSQLKEELPHNKTIHHMITEMQQALCRIPEEVTTALQDSRGSGKNRLDMKPTKLGAEKDPFQNVYTSVKPITSNIATQTLPTLYLEPEKVHKHLESSTVKIEHACNQMESMCTKVKAEKMELEAQLSRERETTKLYQKQLEEYKLKYTTGNALIESLQKKIEEYEKEMKKMRLQMDTHQGPTSQELKSLIKDLQDEKNAVLEESQDLKQKIALASMDCEKYRAILQARDAQVKEIRNEMTQLQEVVNEQLMELQNNAYTSEASSYSNTTCSPSSTWKNEKTELGVGGVGGGVGGCNNTLSSVNSADSVAHHNSLYNNPKQLSHFIELNSGDTTATSDLTHEFHNEAPVKPIEKPTKKRNEKLKAQPVGGQSLSVNFREKFAKIKMEALGCDPRKAEK